ncbi:BRO family protein [Clostridium butyricum]|nr:BRO family protein [Clostridium butyricum]
MLDAPCQNGNMVKTQTTLIPESDIYRLIFGSKLPEAEKF